MGKLRQAEKRRALLLRFGEVEFELEQSTGALIGDIHLRYELEGMPA